MAQNTRSKNSRKFAHTAQLEAHTSLTDEAIVAETYSDNSKSPPDQGLTKRTKIDTVLDETSSEPKVNNDMDIDKNLEKENVVPSNSDAESRDSISADQQTPINTESDDMITDLPNKDTNGAIAPGSSNTQNTQQQNNDEITRSILIFKENTSTTNCQYFIFFTKDQFDANKSNNEIINSIKNAFLTIHHAIGYKYQKKATLEFFTVQINNEECYNNIVDKPIALLNNITPRPYSKDLIDQLIAAKLNKIEECTVKLANVPFNYDVNLLIKHFANFTKQSIASFKEIKPNLKRRRPLDNRNTQRSQSPTYKQYQQPRHGKNINNTQSIPHGSWARPTEESGYNSSNKGKGREQEDDIVELKKQITHLNTIIKDLSSQIKGLDIVQKTHNKDIKLLQEQERRHAEDIEKIRVECEKTNTTITKQSEIISDIPEMASILRNINNSGILTRYQPEQEAYGTHNYAHPPHNLYVEEHVHQQEEIYSEYEDSNNGYESSETINTRIFPDDDNYTPSHPTSSSFPSITSRVGGFLGLHQRQQ
ncbi:hypothetical protein RhiirA1_443946 [Rhizophagus irregularis]|uniref:Uncharacterized protein n=2 Tax=Rhizophagus irregularis TaxID=588596 RepID=A0A2N0RGE7_9GLOM|nr:hypothetical protein RhiirA1_443946 [Rhizophagus irregularis]